MKISRIKMFACFIVIILALVGCNEKNIYWKDESASEDKEATQLRELFRIIEEMVNNKEEYKKLPLPRGGYL